MDKRDLVEKAYCLLRDAGIKRAVNFPKSTLRVIDGEGHEEVFTMPPKTRELVYTREDVNNVLGALISATEDSVKQGEKISIHGFGQFRIKYNKPVRYGDPITGEVKMGRGSYTVKFVPGHALQIACRLYEKSLEDEDLGKKLPPPVYDEDDL